MFQKWLFGYSIPASKVSNEILFLKSISERDGVREDVFSAEKNFGLFKDYISEFRINDILISF